MNPYCFVEEKMWATKPWL